MLLLYNLKGLNLLRNFNIKGNGMSFLAKWVYLNVTYKNENGEKRHVYEWDILDIEDRINEIDAEA